MAIAQCVYPTGATNLKDLVINAVNGQFLIQSSGLFEAYNPSNLATYYHTKTEVGATQLYQSTITNNSGASVRVSVITKDLDLVGDQVISVDTLDIDSSSALITNASLQDQIDDLAADLDQVHKMIFSDSVVVQNDDDEYEQVHYEAGTDTEIARKAMNTIDGTAITSLTQVVGQLIDA